MNTSNSCDSAGNKTKETLAQAALRYARNGVPVFPCRPGAKTPLTSHGFKDATTDTDQVQVWWSEHPSANIGMPTEGMIVIDIDGADNPWPADPALISALDSGVISFTPRGGRHVLFRQPEGNAWRNTAGKIAPKVDTRANGGYIVLPPSKVGRVAYHWNGHGGLDSGPESLPELPEGLAALLDRREAPLGAPDSPRNADLPSNGTLIPSGQRNDALARCAGAMRRVGMSQDEIQVALEKVNQDRCQPSLPLDEVAQIAASIARYEPDPTASLAVETAMRSDSSDPGPLPAELLRVPGFISEVMDYTLATAPYPNPVMAFAGALALQATLAGRKVRDPGDNRTNLYLLGLAHSAAGKDHPRKVNTEILHSVGLSDQVGGQFASGEGLQDALFEKPCMLFQTDEIDGLLQVVNKARDARYETIMSTLLTFYSSANSVVPMRKKAGNASLGAIDQPCLVVFGTAIPNHYYQALSERMLTNGFFARTIVLESGKRSPGQEPTLAPPPQRVLETARWWVKFTLVNGGSDHPEPRVVSVTEEARRIQGETRLEADAEYSKAEAANDAVGTTVWGRANEHARKLALLYAISENHESPEIGKDAALWAHLFIIHQVRRMLFMAQAHVADSPFHADCLKLLDKLRGAPGQKLSHSVLLKRMKKEGKVFKELVSTLVERGDIAIIDEPSATKPGRFYQLARP